MMGEGMWGRRPGDIATKANQFSPPPGLLAPKKQGIELTTQHLGAPKLDTDGARPFAMLQRVVAGEGLGPRGPRLVGPRPARLGEQGVKVARRQPVAAAHQAAHGAVEVHDAPAGGLGDIHHEGRLLEELHRPGQALRLRGFGHQVVQKLVGNCEAAGWKGRRSLGKGEEKDLA